MERQLKARSYYGPEAVLVSTPEKPADTLRRYFKTTGWNPKNTNREHLASQFVSASDESNGRSNFNYLEITNGKLINPEDNTNFLDSLNENTALEKTEKDVARQISKWSHDSNEGIALWISPKLEGVYPGEKAVIYRIAYVMDPEFNLLRKVLITSTILFDADLSNKTNLRGIILTFPDEEQKIIDILQWIKDKSVKERETYYITPTQTRQMAYKYVDLYLAGVSESFIIEQMQKDKFLGNNPMSCPPSMSGISGYSFSNTTDWYGYTFSNETNWSYHIGTCANCCTTNVEVGPCEICKVCEKIL